MKKIKNVTAKAQIDDMFDKLLFPNNNDENLNDEASLNFLREFKKFYSQIQAKFPCYMGIRHFEYWFQLFPFEEALRKGEFSAAVNELEDFYVNKDRFYSPAVKENILWLLEKYI